MYISAKFDRKRDRVIVSERLSPKERVTKYLRPVYEFYYEDEEGQHESLDGVRCSLIDFDNHREFQNSVELFKQDNRRLFESDIPILNKTIEKYYRRCQYPNLNKSFFDIETDWDDSVGGWAKASNPTNAVTAISLVDQWDDDKCYCWALKPKGISQEVCDRILADFPNTFLLDKEADLLKAFLNHIENTDVLSGWNSDAYDIPYLVGRVERVLGKEWLKKFCFWGCYPELIEKQDKYGKNFSTYSLVGRIHLDYMELYIKHVPGEKASLKLDYIGETEVKEKKVSYKGHLKDLYVKDFYLFVQYSRQDSALLNKIDKKLRFIELSNVNAHENGVMLEKTLGTVHLIDQALTNQAHDMGKVVFDKREPEVREVGAAGAYCAEPIKGFCKWFGVIDINSLYPSTLRALNMSPETIIAQLRPSYTDAYLWEKINKEKLWKKQFGRKVYKWTEAWHGLFATLEYTMVMDQSDKIIHVDFCDGQSSEMTGAEIYDMVFGQDNPLIMSANGTIFRRDIEGVVPTIIANWYSGRKQMQGKLAECTKALAGLRTDDPKECLFIDPELAEKISKLL